MATQAIGSGIEPLALAPMSKTDPTMQTKLGTDLDSMRALYHPPSYGQEGGTYSAYPSDVAAKLPQYYPRGITHMPVQYGGPNADKENLDRMNRLIEAAPIGEGGALRVAPIGDKELNYLKYMEDMAELAKFDNYVESFVDPRQPGSAQFLFSVYPEYINRRMQQAHTDYEFALRNQMIDMWGINTFDDLYFKYLVDQGRIAGPSLKRETKAADDSYVASYLAPWKHPRPPVGADKLFLPFASAKIGAKPAQRSDWMVSRSTKPFSVEASREAMAKAIFTNEGMPDGLGAPDFGGAAAAA